jgi:hypothetical protein
VEVLERQNRTLRLVAGLALAVAVLFSLAAGLDLYRRGLWFRQQWSSFKTVDAEAFVVRDPDGRMLARLTQEDPKGLVLKVYNVGGKVAWETALPNP